jgi:hypothetical protein
MPNMAQVQQIYARHAEFCCTRADGHLPSARRLRRCASRPCLVLPLLRWEQGGGEGLLQTSGGSILGRDGYESKAASGGRRRNRKMRWGGCGCAVEPVFSACGRGLRGCQCLERRVSGPASENRCPGRAILSPIPQLPRLMW